MVRFGIPGQNVNGLAYADDRLSTVPMVQAPRRPTVTDKKYPMWCEWRVNKNAVSPAVEGEFWKLIRFESNGDATWVLLSAGTEDPILTIETDDGSPEVIPDVNGNVKILGGVGISVTGNGPGDTVTVSLTGGGAAIDQIDVDFASGSGTDPVLPDGSGQISVKGNAVTNGTNANAPVATHSRNANEYQIDVQLATTLGSAPADPFDVGLSSFDSVYHTITGNGFVSLQERLLQEPIGTTLNLGISYSSPTFTIHGSDGTALSSTNPAWIVIADSANPGRKKVFAITTNYSFEDDSGTSVLTGNTWGTTAGTTWNEAMPFWIYFVINDAGTAVTPMIARNSSAIVATGTIGKPSSAIADSDIAFWALDDSITVGDYDTNPCIRVGVFRMIKNDGANDDWTVQTLNNYDGIGQTQFGRRFVMAINQNGATSRYTSSSNGGDTLPTYNTDGYLYSFSEGGWIDVTYNATIVNNTPAGTGDFRLHLPVQARNSDWRRSFSGFAWTDVSLGAGSIVPGTVYYLSSPTSFVTFRDVPTFGTASTVATPGLFANGDGNFSFHFRYRGFTN